MEHVVSQHRHGRTETKKSNSRIDPEQASELRAAWNRASFPTTQVPRPVGQPEAVKQEGGKAERCRESPKVISSLVSIIMPGV